MPDEQPGRDGDPECDAPDCQEVARALQAHLDGELPAGEARSVADHLGGCRGCELEAETYTEIKAALRRHPDDLSPTTVARLRRFAAELTDEFTDGH